MGHKTKLRPKADLEANKRFEQRYGMKRSEWAKFKKKNKQAAHELRMKRNKN